MLPNRRNLIKTPGQKLSHGVLLLSKISIIYQQHLEGYGFNSVGGAGGCVDDDGSEGIGLVSQ